MLSPVAPLFPLVEFLPCEFLIFLFVSFLPYFQVLNCVSHFPCLSVFLPYSKSYSVHFSYFMFFIVPRDIQSPAILISHFPAWSVYSPYSRSNSVHFSFFMFFSVSRHISGTTMWVSPFPRLSFFSPYSRSYSVCVSFSTFFSFLAIFQTLQCTFHCF